jgi:cephalosporin-C deacetylase-like acetyl esterase
MLPFTSRLFSSVVLALCCAGVGFAQVPTVTSPAATREPNSPANIGRTEVVQYLDAIATKDLEARRAVVASISNREAAEARQIEIRKKILALIGGLPEPTPLNAKIMGTVQADGFRIEKVLFESQPHFYVTALLYLPDNRPFGTRLPAILMSPGHSAAGKAGDFFAAADFARNGFAVLSWDPIGQGERLQYPDPNKPGVSLATRPTGEHGEAGLQPTLIGDAVARYFVWDAMRGIDYLSQRPEIDPRRIGAFGCSGGGAISALVGALDPHVAAVGVACYDTSFDALLASLGPQDGEQSIPGFIAAGLDFPDWIELVAPRPYAEIATYSDMFPFSGARATASEARRFYSIFDPSSAGTSTGASLQSNPTAPALNVDTANVVPLTAPFQFITGPGHHGALAPIMGDIIAFFKRNLQPGSDASHLIPPPPGRAALESLPKDALQVTPTGQVSSSFPGCETIFTLNQKRAKKVAPTIHPRSAGAKLASAIRSVTGATAAPGAAKQSAELLHAHTGPINLVSDGNIVLGGFLSVPQTGGRHPAVILLVPNSILADSPIAQANKAAFDKLAANGNLVLAITPSPSPPGTDDMKSPLLGPFYLLSLRAELVNRTLLGMRTDDVIRIVDYLASRSDVDTRRITAIGSGHMGLVLLHAAVLDPRLAHITVNHVLSSYRSLLNAPLPIGASEDVLPGVLLHYDIPDLVRSLGPRLTEGSPLQGTEDLSQDSTPLETLEKK